MRKFDEFIQGNIFIHCENNNEKAILLNLIDKHGIKWASGDSVLSDNSICRNNFIVHGRSLYFSSSNVNKLDRKVYYFKEVFDGNKFL